MIAVLLPRAATLALVALLVGACAHMPPDDPSDPLESVNRPIYRFNEKLDEWVAQPVARGYVRAVPQFARTGVNNFFVNVTYPSVIVNDFLQGKFSQGARDTGRFLFNITVGMAGLVDVASMVGLEAHDEDFGQTLGAWGLGQGWFLMLPVLGPTTARDGIGQLADGYANPLNYADDEYSIGSALLGAVNARAGLLGVEALLAQQFDRYAFVRGAYLQRRLGKVYDGSPPAELLYGADEDFVPEEEE